MEKGTENLFFESDKLLYTLLEQRYLYMHVFTGADIDIEDLIEVVQFSERNIIKGKYPLLIDMGYGSSFSSEARSYAADRTKRFSMADAFVIKSFAQRLILNFYIRFHKPSLPTSVFKDKEEAMEWLKQFIKD